MNNWQTSAGPRKKKPEIKDAAMHWDTIYMDNKYYMDQSAAIQQLREVQLQLEREY